ncbi:MAG: FtsQ-type POTRA domain-containing protein [Candidatus Aminicenantes bacterium]|nr:FtsQ-type POTRA domain-containing protein [Candidatus Aminicenantes bacterium]
MRSMAGTGTGLGLALRSETDYLRRQNNLLIRKQKKLRSIKIKGIHLLFILTVLSFIAFTIFKTAQFILTWDKLGVKYFQVTDCPGPVSIQVNKVLDRHRGNNILTLSIDALRAQLAGIPEIKDVSVSRNLPSTVAVQLMLREPVFQVETPGEGKYTVMDKEGVVLYRRAEKKDELFTVKNTPGDRVQKILPYLSRLQDIKNYIEYVGFLEPYGLMMKLTQVNEIFYPGEIDFAEKIDYYLKLRNKLNLSECIIKSVDLRFEDRFYLEYEEQEQQPEEEVTQ